VIRVNYATASLLPSDTTPDPGIIRAPRGSNPVGPGGGREMAPLADSATPRVKHPAINSAPWSTSYAQPREEPKSARTKGKRNANKRMKSMNKQRRGN
jgi:hypothetical protein